MQRVLCVLLLAWCCLAAPFTQKESRTYASNEDDLTASVTHTQQILSKVSDFLEKISELSSHNDQSLTPEQAMTLLPEFVTQAVKLKDELDMNPVKAEDPNAVQKVKDFIEESLHTFASKYDKQKSQAITTVAWQQQLQVETTVMPDYDMEPITEDPSSESTTILAPSEPQTTEGQVAHEDASQGTMTLVDAPIFRPIPQRQITHPFSNNKAFTFTIPVLNHVQGPEPIVRWLPSGGYYVHYNQGK